MRALIKDNAAEIYASWINRSFEGYTEEWYNILRKIQGRWIYLETDYFALDHFNTGSIPYVSLNGIRLDAKYIEAIDLMDWTYMEVARTIKEFYQRESPGTMIDMSHWDRLIGAAQRIDPTLNHK
jgi:hypothetical protein